MNFKKLFESTVRVLLLSLCNYIVKYRLGTDEGLKYAVVRGGKLFTRVRKTR